MTELVPDEGHTSRRHLLVGVAGAISCVVLRPAQAAAGDLEVAIANYTSRATIKPGKVKIDIAELVDNGNVVPLTVSVESPMAPDNHVKTIAIFNEKNPQRDVARFTLGSRYGQADVTTRIRLATSQKLVAVAQMSDGSYWSHTVDVIVTLAACIEGEA